jgi:crossover junction endodeoxyribonuclease RusA
VIEFVVPGRARTKGSLKAIRTRYGRTVLIQSNKKEPSWAATVRGFARRSTRTLAQLPTAITISVDVELKRPRRTSGNSSPVRRSSGDVDKLLRSILDALTGVAYQDDSQVVEATIRKRFSEVEQVTIRIQEVKL